MNTVRPLAFVVLCSTSAFMQPANAQQVPCDKVNDAQLLNAPGGCIAKDLEEQIGWTQENAHLPGSSYLIKRDPARSIRRGRQLFQRKFSIDEGLGPRVNQSSHGDIASNAALGAGLADSCAACHSRPRGAAGFGGGVNTKPDSRDAPHLFGLGIVEQLADEMTTALRNQRDAGVRIAIAENQCVEVPLVANKISFGHLLACPGGDVYTSDVKGVNEDLRIRPFFHDGVTVSIREFIIGAFNDEMGLQAVDPVLCAVTDPVFPQAMTSPSGFSYDPTMDDFERPKACNKYDDVDADSKLNEVDSALIDHMEFYLLNYFKPGQYAVNSDTDRGRSLMEHFNCVTCHTPQLTIKNDRRIADVETNYDEERGIFNDLFATATLMVDVTHDNEMYPQMLPKRGQFVVNNFYSDLKRHDLGPAFHERNFDGSVTTEFVTEPLWGVGTTAPYGHDGRSINLDSVIRRHGGEALASRNAYVNAAKEDQMQLRAFLETLVLFPPDDTASNLNPGNPGDAPGIQAPGSHGSINLGALFQIPTEGGE